MTVTMSLFLQSWSLASVSVFDSHH